MTAVEDLDQWQQKSVGLTHSAELVSLEKYAEYAIAIAVNTSNVSYLFFSVPRYRSKPSLF